MPIHPKPENISLFFSHALNEDGLNTVLMRKRYREEVANGNDWSCGVDINNIHAFKWLDFRVLPNAKLKAAGITSPTIVQFYCLPITGKVWLIREKQEKKLNEITLKNAVKF